MGNIKLIRGLSLAGVIMSGPAWAAAEQAASSAEQGDSAEIVVTARLRAESVQSIGQSIAVLSNDAIAKRGIDSFAALVAATPGLANLDRGPGRSMPSLRGVSQVIVPQDVIPQGATIAQFIDEVPVNSLSASQIDIPLYDLARVEVLKGPQPTYFGEGAVGGSIRYFLQNPSLTKVGGRVRAELSSYAYSGGLNYVVDGSIDLPIVTDKLAVRLTGWRRDDAGFIDNATTGRKDVNDYDVWGGSIVALARPSEALDWRGSLIYQKARQAADRIVDATGPLRIGTQQANPIDGKTNDKSLILSSKLGFDAGPVRLESVIGYFRRHYDRDLMERTQAYFVLPVLYGVNGLVLGYTNTGDKNFSHDFRVITQFDGPLNFLGGYYFADTETRIVQNFDSPALAPLGDTYYFGGDIAVKGKQNAIYGEVQLKLLDDTLRLAGGGRYVDLKQKTIFDGTINLPTGTGSLFLLDLAAVAGRISRQSVKDFLPRIQAEFSPSSDVLIYASAAKGIRNGNINSPAVLAISGLNPAQYATYGSDSAWSYEAGIKSSLLDRTLTANASISYTKWSDIQTTTTLAGFSIAQNGPDANLWNYEADISYRPNRSFSAYLSATVTDAKFAQSIILEVPPTPTSPDIAKGDRLPLVPRYKLGFGAEYRAVDTLDFADPLFRVDVQRIGKSVNAPETQAPLSAYTTVNLRAGLVNDSYSLTLFANNVFNKIVKIYDGTLYAGPTPLLSQFYVNTPRTIGITFRGNF